MSNKAILLKTFNCPICEVEFKSPRVRTPVIKLEKTDTDLRPYHKNIDVVAYEIITCPNCGYSAISKTFDNAKPKFFEQIKEETKKMFDPKVCGEEITTEMAIERFRLALLVAHTQKVKNSELFYLYMKLGWLYRVEGSNRGKKYEEICMKNAYKCGKRAYSEEFFPVLEIDDSTFSYILGEMARRLGILDEAIRWIVNTLSHGETTPKLKERALEVKELIKEEKKNTEKLKQN